MAKKKVAKEKATQEKPKRPILRRRRHFESLNLEEIQKLLQVTDRVDVRALFMLALSTGIRREDIVDINVRDVDLEQGHIDFREEKKDRDHRVFLEPQVATALKMYINTLPKGQEKLFDFTGRTAYNYLQKYLKKAGIKKHLRFHDLRTTFIRISKRMGRDPVFIKQQTGDSWRVIQEHYEHFSDEDMKDVTREGIFDEVDE
jgi:integrase